MISLLFIFFILFVCAFGLLMFMYRAEGSNIEPPLHHFVMRILWNIDKRIPFYSFLIFLVIVVIVMATQIDVREIDFNDPINIMISIVIVVVMGPFYWLLWPRKKGNDDNLLSK